MHADGMNVYKIAKVLNDEGIHTRYGKEFKTQTITNILQRRKSHDDSDSSSSSKGH